MSTTPHPPPPTAGGPVDRYRVASKKLCRVASVFGWAAVVIGAGETALGALVFSKWVREIEIGAIFAVFPSVCFLVLVHYRSATGCFVLWNATLAVLPPVVPCVSPRPVASSHGTAFFSRLLLPMLVDYRSTTRCFVPWDGMLPSAACVGSLSSHGRLLRPIERHPYPYCCLCWFTAVPRSVASSHGTTYSSLLLLVLGSLHLMKPRPACCCLCWSTTSHETTSFTCLLLLCAGSLTAARGGLVGGRASGHAGHGGHGYHRRYSGGNSTCDAASMPGRGVLDNEPRHGASA